MTVAPLSLVRPLLRLATPLALIQLAQAAIATTDLIILGQSGPQALAAGALGFAVFNFLRTQGFGLLVGASNLVAEHPGHSGAVLRAAMRIAVIAAVIAATILLVLSQFPALLTPEAGIGRGVTAYLLGIAPGYLPLFLFYACRGVLVGHGRADGLVAITLIVIGLNAMLDYALLHGTWGLPALGIFGVALSSTICFAFQLAAALWLISRAALPGAGHVAGLGRLLLRLGFPTAGSYAVEASFASGLTLMAARLPTGALPAHAVAEQVMYMVFMLSVGLSHATSVLVSRARGRGESLHHAAATGWGAGLVIAGLCALIYLTVPEAVGRVFLREGASLAAVAAILPMAALVQPFDFLQNISIGALRAVRRAGSGLWINMAGYWAIGLPVAWLLAFRTDLGLYGLWLGYAAGAASVAAMLMALFWRVAR